MGRLITRLLMIGAAMGLAVQTADAKGCLEGAALGGIAGHMTHHTFLGIFGGCAGGMMVIVFGLIAGVYRQQEL